MSIYFFSFVFFIIITLLSGSFIYSKYKKSGGLFFLIFSITIPLWFVLFFLSFDPSYGSEVILRIYRFQYSLSIIGFYSVLCFVLFFGSTSAKIRNYKRHIFWIFLFIFLISNFSPFVLSGVQYDEDIQSYAEIYGALYPLVVLVYLLLFPLFTYVAYYKFKKLTNLDRVRITYIISGFLIFIGLILLLTVFIPYFSSDPSQLYLEKYLPFLMLPFIVSVFYASYKYDFSDYKIYLNNGLVYGVSIILSMTWLNLIHVFLGHFGSGLHSFWSIKASLTWLDIFFGIFLFILFFRVLRQFNVQNLIKDKLNILQEQIPFITNVELLDTFLGKRFKKDLFIQSCYIDRDVENYATIKTFFLTHSHINHCVNDFVFLERHKHKINVGNFKSEIPPKTSLIFPLRNNTDELSGLLFVGKKNFNEAYSTQEISAILDFSNFLRGHLKYIDIYSQIQDLTVSLDKKVDEKTIEYNNLLNKQKEFIAYVGHEIKNPITNSLFLTDGLRDTAQELGNKELEEESSILYDELVKVSKLVKHIFSSEKFDLDKVRLYTSKIDLSQFLHDEVYAFRHKFPNIDFIDDLDVSGSCDIDETQFRQVIQNLINNAIKFIDYKSGKILIKLEKKAKYLLISIEDNGEGFNEIDMSEVFGKYSTGGGNAIGLGMGLYLCKKIVELHGGSISAEKSIKLGGACFSIKL